MYGIPLMSSILVTWLAAWLGAPLFARIPFGMLGLSVVLLFFTLLFSCGVFFLFFIFGPLEPLPSDNYWAGSVFGSWVLTSWNSFILIPFAIVAACWEVYKAREKME